MILTYGITDRPGRPGMPRIAIGPLDYEGRTWHYGTQALRRTRQKDWVLSTLGGGRITSRFVTGSAAEAWLLRSGHTEAADEVRAERAAR